MQEKKKKSSGLSHHSVGVLPEGNSVDFEEQKLLFEFPFS